MNYIRIGYWKRMHYKLFSMFEHLITEESLYDEDCGELYSYDFKSFETC
jgi:hypothetical protein